MKGVVSFRKREKHNSHYMGPFEILEKIGSVAYELTLTPVVFHIYMLRRYVVDPTYILE